MRTEPKVGGLGIAKILLVEDSEMNRDRLSQRLPRKGYTVVMAIDGKQGITLAHQEAPDLILMDMSLPEVAGWEATRWLKADELTRGIPIIALTAHTMRGRPGFEVSFAARIEFSIQASPYFPATSVI